MKLGIVVNVTGSTEAGATTYRLAADAVTRGHDVWVMSTGRLTLDVDDAVRAYARAVPPGRYSSERFVEVLSGDQSIERWIEVDELDALLLRSNPSVQHAWAQSAGIQFGRLALRRGVVVLNDPNGLARAMNKLYLQTFPRLVRPRTLVTRQLGRIDLAEIVRPRLVEDGMFLVGLDIVGDKLMEINVFSPGGLGSAQMFEKVDFTTAVLDAIERKVDAMRYDRRNFSNVELATL